MKQIEAVKEALNKAASVAKRIERLEGQLEQAKVDYKSAMSVAKAAMEAEVAEEEDETEQAAV